MYYIFKIKKILLFNNINCDATPNATLQLHLKLPVASLACVVSVKGDGGLQVLEGADLGTQAQVRRGEHGLRPRARDVGHRGGHV